jgi:hypothetical protein
VLRQIRGVGDKMERFKALLKSFIEEVDKIDKETAWLPTEPDWWIDMMNLQRLSLKVQGRLNVTYRKNNP